MSLTLGEPATEIFEQTTALAAMERGSGKSCLIEPSTLPSMIGEWLTTAASPETVARAAVVVDLVECGVCAVVTRGV
jgi:hypothetical protein